jgi:DNA-binding PadR family transcriptional regulator
MMGPPPRAERGEVRYLVLDALADKPRHGYEIIQAIEERSGGRYRPSPGVIYPTLQLLEELEHVRTTEEGGRRVYAITAEGRRDLEAHRGDVDDFYGRFATGSWEDFTEQMGDLADHARRLFRLFARAAQQGRMAPRTLRAIRQVLEEAARSIERILAGA